MLCRRDIPQPPGVHTQGHSFRLSAACTLSCCVHTPVRYSDASSAAASRAIAVYDMLTKQLAQCWETLCPEPDVLDASSAWPTLQYRQWSLWRHIESRAHLQEAMTHRRSPHPRR